MKQECRHATFFTQLADLFQETDSHRIQKSQSKQFGSSQRRLASIVSHPSGHHIAARPGYVGAGFPVACISEEAYIIRYCSIKQTHQDESVQSQQTCQSWVYACVSYRGNFCGMHLQFFLLFSLTDLLQQKKKKLGINTQGCGESSKRHKNQNHENFNHLEGLEVFCTSDNFPPYNT